MMGENQLSTLCNRCFHFFASDQKIFVDSVVLPKFTSFNNLLFFHSLDNVKSAWPKSSVWKTGGRFWEDVILIL